MTHERNSYVARLAEKLARSRTPGTEIVIESGAGSLISRRLNSTEMEATRRSMTALRENAAARRNRTEIKPVSPSEPTASPAQPALVHDAGITIYIQPRIPSDAIQGNATIRALEKKHISYKVVDLADNPDAVERLKGLGYNSAPVVITDTDHWSGFRPDKIEEIASADLSQRLA